MAKQNHDIGNKKRRPRTTAGPLDTDQLAQSLVDRGLATSLILERPRDPMNEQNRR
ncbi:hypothetical protein ACLRGI_10315 [Paenarthrobacter nitroguajacolicus]|uniref:hypothetical protein n=1 Tax=Paenarthrobacter nitroguajacolicus TaxID=211146 RepID=UPI003ADB3620